MKSRVEVAKITKVNKGDLLMTDDLLAVEEPLEIRLYYCDVNNQQTFKSISITMRTPGNDFELSLGFLFTEGIIKSYEQIQEVKYCVQEQDVHFENIVKVVLKPGIQLDLSRLERNFYTTSSCGVCGKASIDAIHVQNCPVQKLDEQKLSISLLSSLPHTLRQAQVVFDHTGGLHAAAAFNYKGELLLMREDVGRHNALDKICGAFLVQNQLPLKHKILLLSGRVSFELVQKAAMAGFSIICAVGAPSNLALHTANSFGITLIGFLRDNRFNIYCHPNRIEL